MTQTSSEVGRDLTLTNSSDDFLPRKKKICILIIGLAAADGRPFCLTTTFNTVPRLKALLSILKAIRGQDLENVKSFRLKCETINECGSKAGREKMRRDRMNERFMELGSILEPGRPPKTDKTAILSDAIRMIKQLQNDAEKLNESNADLHEKIKELKAEKNELRDEKQRLKVEKDKLEQQVKSIHGGQPGYLAHPAAMRAAAFAAQDQAVGNKLMPFVSYPSVAMWQFMPSSVVDTTQDHVLRPPVA